MTAQSSKAITARPLDGMADVLRVRAFLSETWPSTRNTTNWEVRRWEGRYWHEDSADLDDFLSHPQVNVRLWEAADGSIVGVANPEGRGDVHLQIHPMHRHLERAMLDWAERTLPIETNGGERTLVTFSCTGDRTREALLDERGYERLPWGEIHLGRDLEDEIEVEAPAPGYTIRSIIPGDAKDAAGVATVINAAFGHSFGADALLNFERAPSFDARLQMVAFDEVGTITAHVGITVDHRNLLAIVEPVCTHPAHRRRGLATTAMGEGLNRARRAGATSATVSTGWDNPSKRVYASLGFSEVQTVTAWQLTLPRIR